MPTVPRSDDPNRSEEERRRDGLAWAAVQRNIGHAAWRKIDRAVAEALPAAREQGLLESPWRVFFWGSTGAYVTVHPSGDWECGTVDENAGVEVLARSTEPGACGLSMSSAHYARFALMRELRGEP